MNIFKQKSVSRVLFVATDAMPYVKAGGLGAVMYALPRALKKMGYDARVFIPKYAGIDQDRFPMEMNLEGLKVPTGSDGSMENQPKELICNIKSFNPSKHKDADNFKGVFTYFLENREYYEQRSNIYGYNDDAVRWALLSRGVLEFLKKDKSWMPDIIVSSDWQTGFLCNYLRTEYKDDQDLNSIASVFMIHNLYYQGMFNHRFVSELDYDDGQSPIPSFYDPRLLKINGMRRGIIYSDIITTVSQNYAREIMTENYGELLDGLLREKKSRVYGILNGIDYEEYNPETDKFLAHNYSIKNIDIRKKNKAELQSRFGLEVDDKKFLIGIVSRFYEQKGFDLLFSIGDVLLKELDIQFAIQGEGDGKYMGFFQDFEKRYPGRIGTNLKFDQILPHLVFSGSDGFLVPSKFEPFGLTQIEAMRYGSIPIVRRTGGLADTVEDFDAAENTGTGFVFNDFDSSALLISIIRAYENFRNKKVWIEIQKRAMSQDFSWDESAREHSRIFFLAKGFRLRDLEKK